MRRSSPLRVILLLMLIGATVYIYALLQHEEVESPFVPTPTPTRSALSYVAEAEELYLQGDLPGAITTYQQAISLAPNDALPYIPMARLLTLEGQTAEAMRYAQRATEMAPENARAWGVLGMVYDWSGDVPKAIDSCKRAIELDPTYAEGYAYLAEAYADAVRWTDARDAAQTALQLDDHSVDVYRNYGYVLERQGDWEGAIQAYQQALEIHPNLAYIHLAIGQNYSALGNFDAAVESFQRAIEIAPNNADAYYRLGRAYYSIGEYEQAETYLKQAIDADPTFGPAFGHLAFTYWARRNYESAIENLKSAIELECIAARQQSEAFYVTIEELDKESTGPSPNVVLRGEFTTASPTTSATDQDLLYATLTPKEDDEAWINASGTVTFNAHNGEYTVELMNLPRTRYGQTYVGWFDGVNALSGEPLSTGPLSTKSDGSVKAELEATWVEGPRIEHFYTLGLAYFYMADCEKSYPLFNAALQIDPQETNALEGIRLCQEAEMEE